MNRLSAFFFRERRSPYLSGSAMAALNFWMWRWAPSALSFLGNGAALWAPMAVCAAFAALSLAALCVYLTHRRSWAQTAFRRPGMVRVSRVLYALVLVSFLLTLLDRPVLGLVCTIRDAVAAEKNPDGFLASMIYMLWNGRSMFGYGIWTTVRIALIGTAAAFVLAVGMVFLRIQKPARQDDELVRLLKSAGGTFSKVYITVIRGTPMMVQALIIYYAGFGLFKQTNMSVSEINRIWSFFVSGLITVSLNSTAYLAEVLRGGIESIDMGQNEAARSLGMTYWQALCRVVFPQAVKNSIPAIGNEFIINIKDSSVLSIIGCFDLMYATTSVIGIYYRSLQVYCIAAILYLILTYLSSLLMKAVAKKLDTPASSLPSSN